MNKFKHVFKIAFLIVCSLFLCIAFTGCDFSGKSAYELAVENGYEGTLTQWLESLKGKDGKDGKDGADGKDAQAITSLYEEAKLYGFNGTFYEFLEQYVKGDKGETGATGASGTQVVQYAANKAITSVVSIFCTFTKQITSTLTTPYSSGGSGVIYQLDKQNGDAYIITNYHVVYSADSNTANKISDDIQVVLYGQEFVEYAMQASYVGGSMTYDIAVIKISNSDILKNSNATQVELETNTYYAGDTAVAIGNPEGEGIAVTSGIVSVDSEYIEMKGADEVTDVTLRVLRTDAAVNGGNSGGGLFNADGKLIGIVNAKIVDSAVENIGYAIPVTIAVNVADNLIRNSANGTNKVQKATFGISLTIKDTISQYNSENGKVDIIQTIVVDSVTDDGIAQAAGLLKDDQIISYTYNGKTQNVTRLFHLIDQSLQVSANTTLTLCVLRNGSIQNINITVQTLNPVD